MKQPELGRKVAALRTEMGLTQGELAGKCKLSLRTIQRIETAEVTPRSYTVRMIFANLNYQFFNSSGENSNKPVNEAFVPIIWLGQFYRYVLDLFNLKTNTMRKITVLSVSLCAIVIGISSFTFGAFAQSDTKVKKFINGQNENFIKWFNSSDIESLVNLYRDDACLVSRGCGKAFIREYYGVGSAMYKFIEINTTSVSVSDTIAVEKGTWKIQLNSGEMLEGEYLSEWRLTDNRWLIASESSGISAN